MIDPLEKSVAELRQLARGLLYDTHGAEDVVQDAWLAALRAPTSSAKSGGWLAGAVRRLSKNRVRADARRRTREASSARSEAQPAADEQAGRIELLRLVLDALARLPEPHRVAVMLRYFDDLPPREIAHRLSLPVNTVRTHVRRGLERLRADLDGEKERGREEWFAALVAIAGPPQAELAGGAASAVPARSTSFLRAKWAVGGVALAVVTVALVFVVLLRDPPRPKGHESPVAEAARPIGPPVVFEETLLETASSEFGRAPVAAERFTASAWTVYGVVLAGSREPFPGARVRGRVHSGPEPDGEPLLEAVVTADAQGNYVWSIAPPTELVCVEVESLEDSALSFDRLWEVFSPGDAPTSPWNLRVRPPDCHLTGIVRNVSGDPIAGARVYDQLLFDPTFVVSDADGRYAIDYSSTRSTDQLRVCATGYGDRSIEVNLRPGEVTQDVVLSAERRIRGQVVDEFGAPIEGALVSTRVPVEMEATVTDERGCFELGGIDEAESRDRFLTLWIEKEGFMTTHEPLGRGRAVSAELEPIVLRRGVRLSGRVVDSSRNPLPGTSVSAGFNVYPANTTYTDDAGRFELENVREGVAALWMWRVGFAQLRYDVEVPSGTERLDGIEIVLSAPHHLGGVVRDVDGEPVPFAMVWAESPDRDDPLVEGFSMIADVAGRFRFDGLADVSVQLTVLEPGRAPLREVFDSLDRDDVVLQLAPEVALRGFVTDASGNAVPGFTVRVIRSLEPEPLGPHWSPTRDFESPDGSWELARRVPAEGRFLVEIRALGFVPTRVTVLAGRVGAPIEVVRLERGALITGRVLDSVTEFAVEDARVRLNATMDKVGSGGSLRSTRTDADGRFELRGVEPGPATLHVATDNWGHVDGPFEIEGTRPVERYIRFGGVGRITGRLLHADGTPRGREFVSLSAIEVEIDRDERNRRTMTDDDGSFVFDDLRSGLYKLGREVTDGVTSYPDLATDVLVRSEEEHVVDLRPTGHAQAVVRVHSPYALPDSVMVLLTHRAQSTTERPRFSVRYARAANRVARFPHIEGGTTVAHAWVTLEDGTSLRGRKVVELPSEGLGEIELELERAD